MGEPCAECGAYFATPADLIDHVRGAHADPVENRKESLAMNPESQRAGLVCGLCGARFDGPEALAHHNSRPHGAGRRPFSAASA